MQKFYAIEHTSSNLKTIAYPTTETSFRLVFIFEGFIPPPPPFLSLLLLLCSKYFSIREIRKRKRRDEFMLYRNKLNEILRWIRPTFRPNKAYKNEKNDLLMLKWKIHRIENYFLKIVYLSHLEIVFNLKQYIVKTPNKGNSPISSLLSPPPPSPNRTVRITFYYA